MPSGSPKPEFDIITVGESLRDVFYMINEATLSCSIDKPRCLISLEYAEKIPVEQVVKVPAAGNSGNAAVGAGRLGLKTALVSWIGQDHAGRHLKEALTEESVDLRFLTTDKRHPRAKRPCRVPGRTHAACVFPAEEHRLPNFACRAIYYSPWARVISAFDQLLIKELDRHPESRFIFQPGTTHVRAGLQKLKPLLAKSWLFILNQDEARRLLGDGERTVCNLLETFHHFGAQTVIITNGVLGADAFDGNEHWHMPAFKTKVLEPTGAGDSFAIGIAVARLKGFDLPTSLRWGTANGWSVVRSIGPQAGLLTKTGMQRILKKFGSVQATLHKH